ncbi:hypothetical protein QFZ67_000272 [Streptomyces sp. V1I1]|nr:hypothetical protein [Streptomyces sp. V1I1]
MQIVDLDGSGPGLVGLVEALQNGGQDALAAAEDLGGPLDVGRPDTADFRRPRGRALGHGRAQLLKSLRMLADIVLIDPAVGDGLM